MRDQIELTPQQQLLRRETVGQIHFSDVIPEVASQEEGWWRKTDFDASLTIKAESAGLSGVEQIPIGLRPWLATYGLVTIDDLLRSQNVRVLALQGLNDDELHPDALRERREASGAIIVVANEARRDNTNTAHGQNGADFYVALTDAGLEIYSTPLGFLSGLEARDRITALYRIPTKGHPEFNGEHEQFRSARVIRTRQHPDHLEPVFEYASREELIAAKEAGIHPPVIPVDPRTGYLAYVDKFGNVRGELADMRSLYALDIGRRATLLVTNNGRSHEFEVEVAEDLRSAPLGRLAVYANCSDINDPKSNVGFFEIIARVDGSPSTSRETAIFQILEEIPNLNFATAEITVAS